MSYTKDFSVIIPCWRGAIQFLPTLFKSIPERDGIEIIVVDNSKEPVGRGEIKSNRAFKLLHSDAERHAGGSRNVGIEAAQGKWLLFADADDYYTDDAFEIYYSKVETDAEIVYTGMGGIFIDTGEPSDRGDFYKQLVHDFCTGAIDERRIRNDFASPCCKMVSHALVDRESLRFDEIRAGNDIYFSLTCGFFAKEIEVIDKVTYIATVNKGSLCTRRSFDVLKSRYYSRLHCNQFKKAHGLGHYQDSIMSYLFQCRQYGLSKEFELIKMLLFFHQNPFVGWRRWYKTFKRNKKRIVKVKQYIVEE